MKFSRFPRFSRFERQRSLILPSFTFISLLLIWIFLFATPIPIFAQVKGQPRPEDLPTILPSPPPPKLDEVLLQAAPDDDIPVIVQFVRPPDEADYAELRRQVGAFQTKYRYGIIPGMAGSFKAAQIRALSRHPLVESVEYDAPVYALLDGATKWFGAQDARIDFGVTGSGVSIAIIDTGIDVAHVDLDQGKIVGWKDFVNKKTSPYDDNGHGTHVSSIAAGTGEGNAAYKGVAPGASLVGVKVLNSSGSGTLSNVIAGVDWCVQNKGNVNPNIRVINLSLGLSGSSDGTDSVSTAVNNAVGAGLVACVAAGNEGPAKFTIGAPGAAEKAITVGAMADVKEKGFYQANFSSRGPTKDGRIKPDVSGPGVNITAAKKGTTNGYTAKSGTSMATPFVAGIAALMLQKEPSLTPLQVKDRIKGKAIDWDGPGADIDYGAGRLDGYAAVGNTITSKPTVPAHGYKTGSLPGTGASDWYDIPLSTTDPIAITLIMTNWIDSSNPDFDIYLYNPGGTAVAQSIGVNRQEQIGYLPTVTGAYKLEVRSFAGSGSYFFDQSAGTNSSPSVAITDPTNGQVISGTYRVKVSASDPDGTIAKVELSIDSAAFIDITANFDSVNKVYYYDWNTTLVSDASHTLDARATDDKGATTNASRVTVSVDNVDDPPTVAIANPKDGSTVSKTVTIQVSATDDKGINSVEYAIDIDAFQPMTKNATSGYWESSWDTTTATEGSHTVSARATDSGGQTSSKSVGVTVDNTAPTATIANPLNGSAVSGTATIQIDAADNINAAGTLTVEYAIDSGAWQPTVYNATSGKYEASWDTTKVANGAHTISAQAKDNGGNIGTAAQISVNVSNAGLSVTVTTDKPSYVHGEKAIITVAVKDGTAPVSGAAVHVDLTTANGNKLAGDSTTNGEGVARFQYKVNSSRDGVGTYTVNATASKNGKSGSGSTTFEVVAGATAKAAPPVDLHDARIVELKLIVMSSAAKANISTSLYNNYPNPFNPETWMPFSLSQSEKVLIKIYDVSGRLIRTLDLGMKGRGEYISKDRAAYWDGKNQYGDMVSSGIYFYEMQAGSLRAIKKMVVLK